MQDIVEKRLAALKRDREVHTFEIPPGMCGPEYKSVSLLELTADEELLAAKRSKDSSGALRLGYELAKQSLCEVNEQPVSLNDGTADRAWNHMPPKVRSLVVQAYAELHSPPEEATDAFLKSRQVRV